MSFLKTAIRPTVGSDRSQGHEEAMNLVNAYQKPSSSSIEDTPVRSESSEAITAEHEKSTSNPDLQRAKDLVELHYRVKLKYLEEGVGAELQKARDDVKDVCKNLASRSTVTRAG
jgi:hypothetical protein